MIALLEGNIVAITAQNITLLTTSGVGYTICVSKIVLQQYTLNQKITLFTYLKVSEKALDLYGFATQAEKDFFTLLLRVKSVGPKSAMHILGLGSITEIQDAIARKDAAYLCAVQGMGKKTAERLVMELHNKIQKTTDTAPLSKKEESVFLEAVDGLVALGYTKQEATAYIKEVFSPNETTAQVLKKALQLIKK